MRPAGAGTPTPASGSGIVTAAGLAWRAAPGASVGFLALSLVSAALPVAAAWLTRLVLDGLVTPSSDGTALVWVALALGGVGLAGLVVIPATTYAKVTLERNVGLYATGELFSAVNRFDGLARFEDPAFLDRLRLASQAGGGTPS
jgi:ATP-binding cassette, subfamily B, bacterial